MTEQAEQPAQPEQPEQPEQTGDSGSGDTAVEVGAAEGQVQRRQTPQYDTRLRWAPPEAYGPAPDPPPR